MSCAEVQANYPTAGEIPGPLGSPEQVKRHWPSLWIRGNRRRAAVSFFDE